MPGNPLPEKAPARPLRLGLVQTTTGQDPARNTRDLVTSLTRLADLGVELAFTPEMSGLLERNREALLEKVRHEPMDPTLIALGELARTKAMAIAIGSLAIRNADGSIANRSYVIDTNGRIVARYDKIHMFDVALSEGESYHESALFAAGEKTVVAPVAGTRLGLTICYDLRFPALHALLARAGAEIMAQPASFTVPTGRAHWHVLLRARAIETGSFVVAAAQTGLHEDGRNTFGHSLVVDPDGTVLLDMGLDPGEAVVDIDLEKVTKARTRLPVLAQARPLSPPDSPS